MLVQEATHHRERHRAGVLILAAPANRNHAGRLFGAAVAMLVAGSLYRVDAMLVAYDPGAQYSYFPSIPEMLVTVGIVAFEVLAYIVLARFLPVLHRTDEATSPAT